MIGIKEHGKRREIDENCEKLSKTEKNGKNYEKLIKKNKEESREKMNNVGNSEQMSKNVEKMLKNLRKGAIKQPNKQTRNVENRQKRATFFF